MAPLKAKLFHCPFANQDVSCVPYFNPSWIIIDHSELPWLSVEVIPLQIEFESCNRLK